MHGEVDLAVDVLLWMGSMTGSPEVVIHFELVGDRLDLAEFHAGAFRSSPSVFECRLDGFLIRAGAGARVIARKEIDARDRAVLRDAAAAEQGVVVHGQIGRRIVRRG